MMIVTQLIHDSQKNWKNSEAKTWITYAFRMTLNRVIRWVFVRFLFRSLSDVLLCRVSDEKLKKSMISLHFASDFSGYF